MKRCVICDYSSETQTDFTGAKLEYRRILYNKKFDEHHCETCAASLKTSKIDYWHYDVSAGKESLNDPIRYKERVYDVKPGHLYEFKENTKTVNVQDTVFEVPTALPLL